MLVESSAVPSQLPYNKWQLITKPRSVIHIMHDHPEPLTQTQAPKSKSNDRTATWILVGATALTVLAYTQIKIKDTDIWWHMQYGQQFIEQLTWRLDHSVYSWAIVGGEQWTYVSWLGDILLYEIFNWFGWPGLKVLQWTIALSYILVFLWFIRTAKARLSVPFILAMLAAILIVSPPTATIKTENFTMLASFLVVAVYYAARLRSPRLLWLLPPIFLIWVNTHGGFFIGLFFLGLVYLVDLLSYFAVSKERLKQDLRPFVISFTFVLPLVIAATLVNPYGIDYHFHFVANVFETERDQFLVAIGAYVPTWQRLFPESLHHLILNAALTVSAWLLIIFYITFLGIALRAYRRSGFFDPQPFVVMTFFFAFSMTLSRAMLYFPAVALYSVVYVLLKSKIDAGARESAYAALLCVLIAFALVDRAYLEPEPFADDFDASTLAPIQALDFYASHRLPQNLFNDYLSGGYLLWSLYPEYRPFIDPRYQPYRGKNLEEYFRFQRAPSLTALAEMREKYGFDAAFVRLTLRGMIAVLETSPDWQIVYFDRFAAIYLHRSWLDALPEDDRRRLLSADLGAQRFHNVHNPQVLIDLFLYYAHHRSHTDARLIGDLFKRNVRETYFRKLTVLLGMKRTLATTADPERISEKAE